MKSSPQPLETFYPQFTRDSDVKAALKTEYGVRTADILRKMKAGQPLEADAAAVSDLIDRLVQDDSLEVETFYGRGSDGFFPITICSLGPVSFIRASEFDDIGYFASTAAARSHAEDEYEPYGPFVDDPDAEDEDQDEDEDEEPEDD
jgi:hypothetical protein